MNETTPRPRTHRRGLFLGGGLAAAAVAGALAIAVAVTGSGSGARPATGGASPVRLMAASEVLTKASDAAAAGPDLKPRPGQYLYFRSVSRQGPSGPQPRKVWLSVSGKKAGLLDQTVNGGRMYTWLCSVPNASDKGADQAVDLAHPPTGCASRPAYDPTIPTDPKAAKAWLYRNSEGSNPPDVQAFITVGDTIRERYIGARALAALFRAAAQIPGVKVYRNVKDLAGRTGIAVGQTWNYSRQELIFDPKTYKLIGEQEVYDPDTSFHPAGAAKTDAPASPPSGFKPGQVAYASAELGFGLVDRPGQLP